MDFMKEIWGKSLPNFGYVINMDNGKLCVVVLGGQTAKKVNRNDFWDIIIRRSEQMLKMYNQSELSDGDKKELAVLMDKMHGICDFRVEGFFTPDEQATFIETLTSNEKMQLKYQIEMHKECREFFRDYVTR